MQPFSKIDWALVTMAHPERGRELLGIVEPTPLPPFGSEAGTICQGNDARLSDPRPPLAHTHTRDQITNLPAAYTGPLNDSTATKIADVAGGLITAVYF